MSCRTALMAMGLLAQAVGARAAERAHSASSADPERFDGVWYPYQPEGLDFLPLPELTPSADVAFKQQVAEQARGITHNDSTGRCIPPGLPRLLNRVYPMQLVRTRKDLVAIHEYESQLRFIHLDGRQHPQGDDLIPTFNGDSIGHWQGKALVVDTVGFRTEVAGWPTQPINGIHITSAYHEVERWSLSEGGNLLTIEVTITDPPIFAKPWHTMKRFKRRDDLELMEYTCLPDENPVALDSTGADVFKSPPSQPKATPDAEK